VKIPKKLIIIIVEKIEAKIDQKILIMKIKDKTNNNSNNNLKLEKKRVKSLTL
jgi:hypothetical protein